MDRTVVWSAALSGRGPDSVRLRKAMENHDKVGGKEQEPMKEVAVAIWGGARKSLLLMLMLSAVACSSSKRVATIKVDERSRPKVNIEVTGYDGKKTVDRWPTELPGSTGKLANGAASYELPAEGKACITGFAFPDSDRERVGFVVCRACSTAWG